VENNRPDWYKIPLLWGFLLVRSHSARKDPFKMKTARSAMFGEFGRAQHQINQFLWSSDLAYELIRQKVLTDSVRSDLRGVHQLFSDVTCRAFFLSTKARQAMKRGEKPKYDAKYTASAEVFETDLRLDLEPVCRYVIVRFHSALERFIWDRCSPFLPLERMGKEKKVKSRFLGLPYQDLEKNLGWAAHFRSPIRVKVGVEAQGYRMLRNELIHKEQNWQPPWSDKTFREAIGRLPRQEGALISQNICESVARQVEKDPGTPPLFFYALFCLTGYRALAREIEAALELNVPAREPGGFEFIPNTVVPDWVTKCFEGR
jgi:hypothetical protein